jgi:hypothetical protein
MSKKEKFKKLLELIIWIDILSFAVIMIFLHTFYNVSYEILKEHLDLIIEIVIIFSTLLFYIINNYLWKLKPINRYLGSIPNINGKWEGKVQNYNDQKEQTAEINITQDYLEIKIEVKVERGTSYTYSIEIMSETEEIWRLIWTWKVENFEKTFMGTTVALIKENKELEGFYFTNSDINDNKCTSGIFTAKKIK